VMIGILAGGRHIIVDLEVLHAAVLSLAASQRRDRAHLLPVYTDSRGMVLGSQALCPRYPQNERERFSRNRYNIRYGKR
jgi:hypothetical protein